MMRSTKSRSTLVIAGAALATLTLAACQPRAERMSTMDPVQQVNTKDTALAMSAKTTTPAAGEMGMKWQTTTMDSMRVHMREMAMMDGEGMMRMLPMHRDMANGMLTRLAADRQMMNLPADLKWNAVADSVRQDLAGMSALSAVDLKAGMPAHQDRMIRLMDWRTAMTP